MKKAKLYTNFTTKDKIVIFDEGPVKFSTSGH